MTKEANIKVKKFKYAFLKPAAPSKELDRLKNQLEKQAKKASGKPGEEKSEAQGEMEKLLKEVRAKDAKYYEELLHYKLTKHWKEPNEFQAWSEKACNADDVTKYLDGVLSTNPPDQVVSEAFFHASKLAQLPQKCWAKAPDLIAKDGVAYVEKHKQAPDCNLAPFQSKVALELFKKGKQEDVVKVMGDKIQPEDAREMARFDAKRYAKVFLEGAAPTTKMRLLSDPGVRDAVSKDDATWKELSKGMPVLPFFDGVKGRVASKNPSQTDLAKETAAAVFEELLADGNALGMTYYTNTFTPPSVMMAATQEDIKKKIKENHDKGKKDEMPDQPAAQCDELVTVLKYVMEGALDPSSGVKCKHIVIPGMVLTVPMNTLPGGLLKNTFGGNVYDDANTLTKQVLFSGVDFGDAPNAHTYLDVGGVLYDAVLGTKGKAVTDAVADEFAPWDKTGWVTKDDKAEAVWVSKSKTSGNYVVKQAGLTAAANRNGFSTAYRLTTKPTDYVKTK